MNTIRLSILISLLLPYISAYASSPEQMWQRFVSPPSDCRTKVWWFHGETESTDEGIDADLTEFKRKGVGGVVYYDQIHGRAEGAPESMSPQWWHSIKHAAAKAKELGLSFEVAASNGYVAGGPWITKDLAMKKTAFSDTLITIDNPVPITISLPAPGSDFTDVATVAIPDQKEHAPITALSGKITIGSADTILLFDIGSPQEIRGISYEISPRGKGSTGSMNIPGKPSERYFGALYKEYPPIGQLEWSSDGGKWQKACDIMPIESNIGHKSRRRSISFPMVNARYFRIHAHDWNGGDNSYKSFFLDNIQFHRRDIVDNLETKSALRTEVTYPTATGGNVGSIRHSDVRDITSCMTSIDNYQIHLPAGTWRIIRFGYLPTGARTKHGRKAGLGYEADVMSAEAANMQYEKYFKTILDTLASIGCAQSGMAMDSHEAGIQNWTHGFERTFSQTAGYSLTPWIPALCGIITDDRDATDKFLLDFRKAIASTIADEFYGTLAKRCSEDGVRFTSQAMLNIATDNVAFRGRAHVPQGEFWAYQKNGNYDCLDAASAAHIYGHKIASGEAFTDTPYSTGWDELLRIANIAYCRGLNEFVICASSHQPWTHKKYDDSESAHPYVFHRFHPRWEESAPFWDQQARCTAMLREGSPAVDLCVYLGEDPPLKTMAYRLPDIPEGYNFDVCTFDALTSRMRAQNGEIAVTGGMKYKAILIEERTQISARAQKHLNDLEKAGAKIIHCGMGEDISAKLLKAGITPDIEIRSANMPDERILFFHRITPDSHIYFIYNHSGNEYRKPLRLRDTAADVIEIWDPATAMRSSLPIRDFKLAPYQALFVIAPTQNL